MFDGVLPGSYCQDGCLYDLCAGWLLLPGELSL